MGRIDDLLAIFRSHDYRVRFLNAKASGTCVVCRKPALRLQSVSVMLEYSTSALCQECQDRYFRGTYVVSEKAA
jgi:hypothetical protein